MISYSRRVSLGPFVWEGFSHLHVFDGLDSVEEYWSGILEDVCPLECVVFLMIRPGLRVVGKRITIVKCHSHHILPIVCTVNMIGEFFLPEVVFVKFSPL